MPDHSHSLRLLEDFRNREGLPGVSIAVLRNGVPEVVAAVGTAGRAGSQPLTPDAVFPIYSVTKTLIAVAVLLLRREHAFELEDPIQQHLPGLPFSEPLTLRQLLTHTSGLPDYGPTQAYKAALQKHPAQPWTAEAYLDVATQQGLQPQGQFSYSNIGYLLLKMLLKHLTGETLKDLLHRLLFAPLKLQHTRVIETQADLLHLTPGFSKVWGQEWQDVRSMYHPGWVAHGLVASTASELALLLDSLFTPGILKPQEMGELMEGVVVADHHPIFTVPGYGLGLMLDALNHEFMGHGGGGPGYSIGALHCPDRYGDSITCVAMVNQDGGWGLDLAHQGILHLE
ncbi:serine hydrolase domain-containing protein [Deinococcus roseus]|uniref:Serine hydrolase n=1 Tax=Deinococcus roseus TaxID=392414 RepID=A0ABQ2DCH7_9DEIO|nr:serine hydrolase domain-containing protein [Deinococcus roseus]GGJ53577.1 serine hydrolase [Deinococcus roseus]